MKLALLMASCEQAVFIFSFYQTRKFAGPCYNNEMQNTLVKIMGWRGTLFHGDTLVYDRWKWLTQKIARGSVRTLDAGCGSGCFSFYASSVGNEVVGVYFDGPKLASAKARGKMLEFPRLNFHARDLRELDKSASELGLFDQIFSFDVIEHVMDHEKLVRDMASLLKPGGRLILTTPYKNYHPLIWDKLSQVEDGGHVRWGYTFEELEELFRPHGLRLVERDYISGYFSRAITNAMRVATRVNKYFAWGVTFPLRALQSIDDPFTRMVKYPFCGIAVVAEKI